MPKSQEQIGPSRVSNLKVSVIVPTKGQHESLKRCLASIVSSYSSYAYEELIVVDSSGDDVDIKLNRQLAENSSAIYCYEAKPGLAAARNTGINRARGDIIVFADDDFVVDKDWIKNTIPNYENGKVICCTGRMLPYRQDNASRIFERILGYDRGSERRLFTEGDISIFKLLRAATMVGSERLGGKGPVPWCIGSGFCSFRKSVFDEVGYFDENLRVGAVSAGEDMDMFYRILKNKHEIVYEPKSIIYHEHPQTLDAVLKRAYTYGRHRHAFFTKYHKDLYMLLCSLGSLFFNASTWLKLALKSEREERKMVTAGMKGFFDGFRKS